MFGEWKGVWQETAERFRRELHGDAAAADPAVRAMREALARRRAEVRTAESELARTRRRASEERRMESDCRRRERLARDAGDAETAAVAIGFAAHHADFARVLERKAEAIEAERAFLAQELAEMERVLRERRLAADAPSTEEANGAFRDLEHRARAEEAARRLAELKRRMER